MIDTYPDSLDTTERDTGERYDELRASLAVAALEAAGITLNEREDIAVRAAVGWVSTTR